MTPPALPVDPGWRVWQVLCQHAHIDPRRCRKVWKRLSEDRRITTFSYACSQALTAGPAASLARYQAAQQWSQAQASSLHVLCDILERCVARSTLTRSEVTAIEEALFHLADRRGHWK